MLLNIIRINIQVKIVKQSFLIIIIINLIV